MHPPPPTLSLRDPFFRPPVSTRANNVTVRGCRDQGVSRGVVCSDRGPNRRRGVSRYILYNVCTEFCTFAPYSWVTVLYAAVNTGPICQLRSGPHPHPRAGWRTHTTTRKGSIRLYNNTYIYTAARDSSAYDGSATGANR